MQNGTCVEWNCEFNTLRRQDLFQNAPKDHSAHPLLQLAVNPHIESFDAIFTKDGLIDRAIKDIGQQVFTDKVGNTLTIWYKSLTLAKPQLPASNKFAKRREVYPAECRQRHSTYRGRLTATIQYRVNDGPAVEVVREWGQLPIMVKSRHCYLRNKTPAELVRLKEETEELGGYFIVNGNEKLIRLLLVNRRNFPMAINRSSFMKRGPSYTQHGIIIRCVRPDETSQSNVLHYLKDGKVTFRFHWRKQEYLVPVVMVLKALVETTDFAIFKELVGEANSRGAKNTWLADRVELLLRDYNIHDLHTRSKTRAVLGDKFRVAMALPDTVCDYDAGTEFLRRIVLVHLGNVDVTEEQDRNKFKMIIFMLRKLYALVAGECAVDNPDAVQNQELLLGGFLYGQILKENMNELISTQLSKALREYMRKVPTACFTVSGFDQEFVKHVFRKLSDNVASSMEYFLSTGNLSSPSGLDLQQTSGFTIVAEKLNFLRFISHFRMVHRGTFFQTLKTTAVRKLLPESWGFLCPVHTPDGGPCGLLNHLAHKCKIITRASDTSAVPVLVAALGVLESSSALPTTKSVVVMLDGRILGWCHPSQAKQIADTLRHYKVQGLRNVPKDLEIGHVPNSNGGSYPGIYMSSTPSRLVRPVRYLPLDLEDLVGPHEQPYMLIAVTNPEIVSGEHSHVEYDPTNMLSILANMTPFSDFNQSPRNMYQCQMGKQTMGTPGTALAYRTDNKLYLLQTGQTPIARSPLHNAYGFDNFPNGTNAVVAVISYTGYDMDDAMIINKSAHERGFAYGSIYKTKKFTIKDTGSRSHTTQAVTRLFGFNPVKPPSSKATAKLDADGLPTVGQLLQSGDPLCAWYAVKTDFENKLVNVDVQTHFERYKDSEPAYVTQVRLVGSEHGDEPFQTVSITLRIPRPPVIGDKFSSRHGQKGVCSQKWPMVDLPFTESGMQPDVIINPHAFPSRMTIGMFIESLAGKSGALHGLAQDSTPFQFDEANTAGDYFGHQLLKAGFNYHGNEPMYSGITGEELAADIYIGVVYYQRLRHMVNDKFQVRTTGPVVQTTGQPVKGRKRGGGIRVGEMERDSLLAHGTAFLLQDRLMNCSDYTKAWLCRTCGSFISTQPAMVPSVGGRRRIRPDYYCRLCSKPAPPHAKITHAGPLQVNRPPVWQDGQGNTWIGGENTVEVAVPGVLRYLDVELAAMGVKLKYKADPRDKAAEVPKRKVKDTARSDPQNSFGGNNEERSLEECAESLSIDGY